MGAKTIKTLQIVIVSSLALYATLVFAGNLMDYNSNYEFVKHVLAMDTTFEGNKLMWRAITNETLVTLAYWFIIAVEGTIAALAWVSAGKMCRRFKAPAEAFNKAKTAGVYAFILALLLWFVGFICFGSEWFAMWQSSIWNGKQTAMDLTEAFGVFLIIFVLPVQLLADGARKGDARS
jgi:Predicted small integral membrane protein